MTDSRGWPKLGGDAATGGGLTSDRHRQRAEARAEAARLRAESAQSRAEERAKFREAQVAERERNRDARRAEETQVLGLRAAQLGIGTGLQLTTKRRRRSGTEEKETELKRERDTRGYSTLVDPESIRGFAARGVSVSGIAAALGITEDVVEAALDYRDVDQT